jgi:hypothetical protein
MCRSIKTLFPFEPPATDDEFPEGAPGGNDIHAAVVQFVRKISGTRTPSKKNDDAFHTAIAEIDEAAQKLLRSLAHRRAQRPQRRG